MGSTAIEKHLNPVEKSGRIRALAANLLALSAMFQLRDANMPGLDGGFDSAACAVPQDLPAGVPTTN